MSIFHGDRQMRPPVKRWPTIRMDVLMEDRYKAGHPPFGPFPTVTNIVNAALCPVASVHDLLYGIDDARIGSGGWGTGSLFHEFICHVKKSLADGSCMLGGEKRLYDEFTERKYDAAKEEGWVYVQYWLGRKREELRRLRGDTKSYFEVHVANDGVTIEGGYCSYPLRGKIDELDTKNRRVIERTILGADSDKSPPAFKDLQLWLLWKVLCSIEKKHRPQVWSGEDFGNYELVVETPYKDFIVPKNSKDFEEMAHDAFSWVLDISSDRFKYAISEAYEAKPCSYDIRNSNCTLGDRYCYRGRLKYPEGRRALHADMRRFSISLLNEQMWSNHLLWYQLMKLPVSVLSNWKIVHGAAESAGGRIVVKVDNSESLNERAEEGEATREMSVIFGDLRLGILRKTEVETQKGDKIWLNVWGRELLPSVNIILPEASLLREEPWFLRRRVQRETYDLELWGLKKEEKAKKHSVIQIVDAIFWDKGLVMKRPPSAGKGGAHGSRREG
jgi:hypothetical protein